MPQCPSRSYEVDYTYHTLMRSGARIQLFLGFSEK